MMFVYILSSGKRGTLYIGVTNDLIKRVHQHKTKAVPGFSSRYDIDRLVYFEQFDDRGKCHPPRKATESLDTGRGRHV